MKELTRICSPLFFLLVNSGVAFTSLSFLLSITRNLLRGEYRDAYPSTVDYLQDILFARQKLAGLLFVYICLYPQAVTFNVKKRINVFPIKYLYANELFYNFKANNIFQ